MKRMPGIPLVTRETNYYPRSSDQMCRQGAHVGLSDEERIAAEESLSVYCKPVEFYNILKWRACVNPTFLQRCLSYKIQAKHKTRIQLAIKVPEILSNSGEPQNPFPIFVLLGRRTFSDAVGMGSHDHRISDYHVSRMCTLKDSQAHGTFVLPEITKLAEDARSGSLDILFVCADGNPADGAVSANYQLVNEGRWLYGKLSLDLVVLSWERSQSWISHQAAEMTSVADLHSSFLKWDHTNDSNRVSVQMLNKSTNLRVQVNLSAFLVGSSYRSPYDSHSCNNIPVCSLPRIRRLRAGNVVFNYRYYNNRLQKTEATEDFCCPFCLVKCASFKGLRCHLPASHDLFEFEFWVNEEHQAVNISVKTDMWIDEIAEDEPDPKLQGFFYRSSSRRGVRKIISQNGNHMRPSTYKLNIPGVEFGSYGAQSSREGNNINVWEGLWNICSEDGTDNTERTTSCNPVTGALSSTCLSYDDLESVQSETMLHFIRAQKLPSERSESRNRSFLHLREFYHSQRAQPMERAQVLAEEDSEDEVDDYIDDLEDRRMLDDFVDVTKDEKQLMHMWNSFVRRQRVLADGHIPWACEAFSSLHRSELDKAPSLKMCWKLFMIKLWNHGLLDARSMNSCNRDLEQHPIQGT